MRPRREILQLFSTFIQLADDRFERWAADPNLQRSMTQALSQADSATLSESFWSTYWYRCWAKASHQMAESHLASYLQEPCYTAAQRTLQAVTSQQTIADGFQVAIAALPKVLKSFDADYGASLKSYAQLVFSNTLRDNLRQRREVSFCTDWVLLRKLSQKRFQRMLETAGHDQATINSYRLAWMSFQAHYVPSAGKRGYQQADNLLQEQLEAIVTTYNQQRDPAAPKATPNDIESWLKHCAKRARAYLHPTISSLNAPRPGFDSGELQDDLVASAADSLLSELIVQEEKGELRSQQATLNTLLTDTLAAMPADSQKILELYYRHGEGQQAIATQLGTKQYTVSRRLKSTRKKLLETLAQWSAETLHISLDATALDRISVVLEDWLQNTYGLSTGNSSQGE